MGTSKKRLAIVLICVVILAIGAFAVMGNRNSPSQADEPASQGDPSQDSQQAGTGEPADTPEEPEVLNINTLEFAHFSMEGPEGWAQDYGDLSSEEGMVSLSAHGAGSATMTVFMNTEETDVEAEYDQEGSHNLVAIYLADGTGEQVDVDGHVGCFQRQDYGDVCNYNLVWYVGATMYSIDFSYPVSQADTYEEYAKSFWQTIQMTDPG